MSTVKCATIVNASSATNNLVLNSDGSVTTGNALIMGSGSFLRNKIINGGMNIDQRNEGASQTITAAAALAYTVDRWYAYCTGANVTGQRVTNTGTSASPSQRAYQFTGAASVTAIGFGQRIEAVNCYDLANTTATLSVNLANSVLTTVTWTAYYANTTDTFGTLASPTVTQIATGTFTVSSTLTRYTTNISIPAAATTGIQILFTVGAQTSGTWTIGNVQLEAGAAATPFERVSFTPQLTLCQRYYSKTFPQATKPAQNAGLTGAFYYPQTGASVNALITSPSWLFPVTMRAATTVTIYNPSAANAQVRNVDVPADCSATALKSSSVNGVTVTVTNASGGSQGGSNAVHFTCDGEL